MHLFPIDKMGVVGDPGGLQRSVKWYCFEGDRYHVKLKDAVRRVLER